MEAEIPRTSNTDQIARLSTLIVLTALLVWSYWNSLTVTANFWDEPRYSHGYLVPLFAVVLLWLRRQPIDEPSIIDRILGILLVAAGMLIRLTATDYESLTFEMLSFLPCLVGLFVFVGGWRILKWSGAPLAFLIFMYPVHPQLDQGLSEGLQGIATAASTFALQTLGVPSFSDGHRIVINDLQLGVVEACSGLRMLTIFIAMSVAIALIIDRPIWERILIVFTSVPIALLVNVIRITLTGLLYMMADQNFLITMEMADTFFHDAAGWFMMPMALGLLYLEMLILSRLFVEVDTQGPLRIGPTPSARTPQPA